MWERLKTTYHWLLAFSGAIVYRFPARRIFVIGVTGTKGKTSVVEIISALLEEAGFTTALSSTLRFKIGKESRDNLRKMTMPGRWFLPHFLRRAVLAGCHYAIIEMTSEGAKQFRHKFIALDALIVTHIAPEHLESHGSYEKYLAAKLEIAGELARSPKKSKIIAVNGDDREHEKFLAVAGGAQKVIYRLEQTAPYQANDTGGELTINGVVVRTRLPGKFNLYNVLAAVSFACTQNVAIAEIKEALEKFAGIRGRMEPVGRQEFDVIVDYAHTPDSLRAVYETFGQRRKICVLGGTGGGRDRWKRPLMGKLAAEHCYRVILTDEDPYDEDPEKIVQEVAGGIKSGDYQIIMDRRQAIREAIKQAKKGDAVIITGKGTDPFIMGPRGAKQSWSDAAVAHEELENLKRKVESGKGVFCLT